MTHKARKIRKSEPIFIYDRNETLQLILSDDTTPYTGGIVEELNGSVTIDIEILADNPDVGVIENEGRMVTRDSDGEFMEFVIRDIEDSYDDNGPVKKIEGEGGEYDLIDDFLPGYTQPSVDIQTALKAVLQGTRWNVGHIDNFGRSRPIELNKVPVRKAVIDIVNQFEGEVKYRVETKGNRITKRYIDVYRKRGTPYISHRFEVGRDIKSTTRELDSTAIKTAIYGYGKSDADGNRLNFSDIEWIKANGDPVDKPLGQSYVGDPKALKQWGRQGGRQHKFGFYDGQEEDPAELLLNTWQELQKKNGLNDTYDVDVLNLGKMLGIACEEVRLGDTVTVVNREICPEMVTQASVIEYNHDLNDKSQSTVKLGNFRRDLDLSGRVNDVEKDYHETKGEFEKKPEQVRNDLQNEINDEISKVDGNIADAKQEAQDAFERANKAVRDAQDGFDKAQSAIKKANANEGKYSDIQKTVNSIATRVDDNEGNYSSLSQTVSGLQTRVSNDEDDISSVTQTANALVSRVGHKGDTSGGSVFSQISQLDDDINLRVKKGDVVSQINLTSGNALISADKINFDGKVFGKDATFKGTITGGKIQSNTDIDVNRNISVGNQITLEDKGGLPRGRRRIQFGGSYLMHSTSGAILSSSGGDLRLTSSFDRVTTDGTINVGSIASTGSRIMYDPSDHNRLKLDTKRGDGGGIWIDERGSVYFRDGEGGNAHRFSSDGTKKGGSMKVEGKRYGMSPIDSPQTVISDVMMDVHVDGELDIFLNETYAKMIESYAVFPSSPDVRIKQKNDNHFVVNGEGYTDFMVHGMRDGLSDEYFSDMNADD